MSQFSEVNTKVLGNKANAVAGSAVPTENRTVVPSLGGLVRYAHISTVPPPVVVNASE
jgi:hypothetical protein